MGEEQHQIQACPKHCEGLSQLVLFGNALSAHDFLQPAERTMSGNDDFRVRPGKIRSTRGPQTKSFLAQALQAAQKAGGLSHGSGGSSSRFGRGRAQASPPHGCSRRLAAAPWSRLAARPRPNLLLGLPAPRERPPAFCAAWSACARNGFARAARVERMRPGRMRKSSFPVILGSQGVES